MKPIAGLASLAAAALALLVPSLATAQKQPGRLQPHRAEYTLRLGTSLNATRIGTIVQDIALTCDGWRLRRELSLDASLTPSFRVTFTSRLEGEAQFGGFAWRGLQVMNGAERAMQGTAERKDGGWRVDRTTPDGPEKLELPSFTHMPVGAVDWLLRRLAQGGEGFPLLLFVPEAEGGAFLLDVKRAAAGAADATPPSQRRVDVPVTRTGQRNGKAILTLRGRLFDSGVMDGLVVDAGVVTVAAHLRDLNMHATPACPKPD